MGLEISDILDALNSNLQELQENMEMHCRLMSSILENRVDENDLLPLLSLCPKRSREVKLEIAIKEAIEILEESRKAFKSKTLEALRKKLTQTLIDVD